MDVVDSLSTAPGTDAVPSLDFDLITAGETQNLWCEQCKVLKKNYEKLQEEHALSYNTLKKKIISTDLLIKKYKTKCEDHDQQTRKLEDVSRKQEQFQRESETLKTQLSAALRQIEPLKQEKLALEQDVKKRLQEIQNLRDQVVAGESFKTQYEQLNSSLLEGRDKHEQEINAANKKIRELEQSHQKQDTQLKKMKEENKTLKRENGRFQKKERKTEESLTKAEETIEKYRVILIQHGLLPKHDRLQRIRKGMESRKKAEESSSQEDDDLVDPGFVSDHDTDLNQTRNYSELNATTKTLGIPHSEGDRQPLVDPQEEEGSLMEFPFTFSPLTSVLSPLPPSPQSYRKEVEDNEDSDEDWDEMAKQMEQEIVNMPPTLKRSPRKPVPPSPLLKNSQTTVMVASSGGPKTLGPEMRKYEKQVTVHNRKDNRNLKGNQEGNLGEKNSGGNIEMKGIKRITFVSEELETGGEMVNSEVALVNPKPILCGHHNSAFQKFSKTSPKQETTEGEKEDRPKVKLSNESGTIEDSKSRAGDQSLIHGKRIDCLRQHAFRPVSVIQEESDSMGSMESTGFTSKLTEATCNSTDGESSSVNHNEDNKDAYINELTEIIDPDVDIESALSIRTLRKSLSLPGGEPASSQGLVASPSSRKKRISSLPNGDSEKDLRKCVSSLKSVPESPRRSQRNRSGEVGQFNENSKTCAETTSKETVQSKQKTPSRLTRSQTVLLSTNDLDPLCQRSRGRMKIPSGKKRKEENSVKSVSEMKQGCLGEDDMNNKLGKLGMEDEGGDPEGVRQMTCDKSISRQDSLGFALRSPPVLKAPPTELPSQKRRGVGTTSGEPQMETNFLTKDRQSKCSPKKQVEGLLVKNSKDNLNEKERKTHQNYCFQINSETSAKSIENSGDKDTCLSVKHENTDCESIPSDSCSVDHSEKNSDKVTEEGLVEEVELSRQGSIGFVISCESGVDPEKAASNSVSIKSMEIGVDPEISTVSGESIQSGRENFIRSRKKSFGTHKEQGDQEDENKGPGFVQQVQKVRDGEKIVNGGSLVEESSEGNMVEDLQNINVEGHSGRVKDTGILDSEEVTLLRESSRELDSSVNHNLNGVCKSDVEAISHASDSSERNVRSVQQSKISETLVSCVLTKSVSKSAGVKLCSEIKAQTKQQRDIGSSSNGVNVQSIPASSSVSRQPPTSFPPEGSSSSSFPVYVPSLSKLVQRARLSSGVPSSTVVSPEMESFPTHPPTDNSSTPRSPPLSAGGPVSPLPPSPFHFFLPNPISPLPPSPVKEVVPISPLCTSPYDLEDPVPVHLESSESNKTIQVLSTKTSIASSSSSSIRQTSIRNQCHVSSHNAKETRTSQSKQSGKKLVQSDASPCTFHAVAPPDAIPVKAQTAVTRKSGSELSTARKRRSVDHKVSDVEVMEKKQCLENNTAEKKGTVNKNNNVDLYKVIEAEMKHFLQGSENACQETIEKLVPLADHSTISSHLLQWTIQFLRCQEVELFGTIHCYCAYSSDCQSRTDPFLTQGEARLLQFYSLVFQNPKWAPQRQQLMDMLWRAIFSPDSLTLSSKLALCRVFVGLLYDVGDMEHVRVFFYQVMTSKFLNAPMVAVAIAGVWPQCLYRNSSGASPVLVVMEACIMRELQEVKDRGAKIAECLKRLVNWDLCVHQNNVLLQHLVKEIENKCEDYHSNQGEVFELRRAVELLLVRQRVGFFKTVFVGVAMGTIHSKLRSKKTEAAEHYVRVIIQIAGSVLMQVTSMNEKKLSQIIRKYITKTLMSEQASQDLQLSIAQTLLELSFLSPVTVLSGSLYPWFLANKNSISADFVRRMERTRQTLIRHFPYFRCPEFVL